MHKIIIPFFILAFSAQYLFAQHNSPSMVPSVACDTVIQTSTCAGGNVIVPFTVTGGNFTFGNIFTAQLSNQFGQFTAPVNIGTIPWFSSGFILATIPLNTNFSFFYRIRVIASNPMDTSNPSPNPIIVTQVAQLNQIIATPHNYVCPGDSITLTAINIASSYSWSTGDTTQSIVITQPGIYSVTTTDQLTCQSSTADTLYTSCTGVEEHTWKNSVGVYPNPADDELFIRMDLEKNFEAGISLCDLVGQQVYHGTMRLGMGVQQSIDISKLPAGIYFIDIVIGDDHLVTKVMVK